MAEITEYIDLTVTVSDAAPGIPNFGAMLLAANSETGDAGLQTINLTPTGIKAWIDTYSGESDDIGYVMLAAAVAQTPHTDKALWYNTKSALTDLVTITPLSVAEGKKYEINVNGTVLSYTAVSGDTDVTVATALSADAAALAGVDSTVSTNTFTLTGTTASDNVFVKGYEPAKLQVEVGDSSAGDMSDALDAAAAENSDFYGVLIDVQDDVSIADAAAWAETNRKLLFVRSKDKDVLTGGGVLQTLFDAGYHRTALFYSEDDTGRLDAASLARFLATDPGQSDVQFKNHAGVTVSKLTASQFDAVKAKNGIPYTKTTGVTFTDNGVAVSGRPIAVTRNVDWLDARIKQAVLTELVNNEIVIIDKTGIALIEKALRSTLAEAERKRVILPGWSVTVPVASEIATADVNDGLMPGFEFSATTGKATRKVEINGTLV